MVPVIKKYFALNLEKLQTSSQYVVEISEDQSNTQQNLIPQANYLLRF
jgi:hypothetical protein